MCVTLRIRAESTGPSFTDSFDGYCPTLSDCYHPSQKMSQNLRKKGISGESAACPQASRGIHLT